MVQENNKAIAKKVTDLWNTGNLKNIDEVYAPNCIFHQHHHPQSSRDIRGTTDWKKFILEFREAFPDFKITIEDQIATGDKLVLRFTCRGTQKGEFMGFDPTDKKLIWTGISIYRLENNKIVESWVNWDMAGLFEQIGVICIMHPTY